jgi:hypothetical protein
MDTTRSMNKSNSLSLVRDLDNNNMHESPLGLTTKAIQLLNGWKKNDFVNISFIHLNNITCTFNSIFKKWEANWRRKYWKSAMFKKKTGKRLILKKTPFHASLLGNGINRVQPTRTLRNPMDPIVILPNPAPMVHDTHLSIITSYPLHPYVGQCSH